MGRVKNLPPSLLETRKAEDADLARMSYFIDE
jgi:hypothetical protein